MTKKVCCIKNKIYTRFTKRNKGVSLCANRFLENVFITKNANLLLTLICMTDFPFAHFCKLNQF